jgi:hypothetical protein
MSEHLQPRDRQGAGCRGVWGRSPQGDEVLGPPELRDDIVTWLEAAEQVDR